MGPLHLIAQRAGADIRQPLTYDDAGNPTWYVASNCAVSGDGCQGSLYKVTGGSSLTTTWHGTNPATSAGTLSLAFTDDNTGTMNYSINGVNGSKAITRQVWRTVPGVDLSSLDVAPHAEPFNYTYTGTACSEYGAKAGEAYKDIYTTSISTSGSSATLIAYDIASYQTFSLQYQSGDSSNGFNFTGSLFDKISGITATVEIISLKRFGPNPQGQYWIEGFFIITPPNGCKISGTL